jgi:Zn finger protein HypA/HybF involved in hydrogenase expression
MREDKVSKVLIISNQKCIGMTSHPADILCPKCENRELYLKSTNLYLVFNKNAFSVHNPLGHKIQLTLPIEAEFQRVLFEKPDWVCSNCNAVLESDSINRLARNFLWMWEQEHLGVNPSDIVQYQEGPVIGLCKFCQKIARLNSMYELECPKCGSTKGISRFVWDPNSQHPA